jgi:hypothetical protein
MRLESFRRAGAALLLLMAAIGAATWAESIRGGFEGFWGSNYRPVGLTDEAGGLQAAEDQIDRGRAPLDTRARVVRWNAAAIDASGLDHTPVAPGDDRVFGEQLGPHRASRAMAIVHIAMFDAINAVVGGYRGYTDLPPAPPGTSVDAAVAQAAHDTLAALFPSQRGRFARVLRRDLESIPERGKDEGIRLGHRAAAAIAARRQKDGSDKPEPRVGVDFRTSNGPGKWRQDPISKIPLALGAYWSEVKPFVLETADQFRVPPPPELTSRAYAAAFEEVKRLGGDGSTTPTQRTDDQASIGIYWAYDGMPSLCAPPRLYNQIAMVVADQMGTEYVELARLLALVNVAMADAGIAIWEAKYHYQFWRPVTGIREADEGSGPTGAGDGNEGTKGDATYSPLGAPASNLSGPDFTPPFPAYPSGHAGFGGALFEVLRLFYQTDDIAFTFTSDEYNGLTMGEGGLVRPLHPRSFTSLSEAEEQNGQSRIYLGIHWSFDKTQGIAQGRQVARYVVRRTFRGVGG